MQISTYDIEKNEKCIKKAARLKIEPNKIKSVSYSAFWLAQWVTEIISYKHDKDDVKNYGLTSPIEVIDVESIMNKDVRQRSSVGFVDVEKRKKKRNPNDIRKADLVELKSLKAPPQDVKTVIAAMALLLGGRTDWHSCQNLLNNNRLLADLAQFDRTTLTTRRRKRVKRDLKGIEADGLRKKCTSAVGVLSFLLYQIEEPESE